MGIDHSKISRFFSFTCGYCNIDHENILFDENNKHFPTEKCFMTVPLMSWIELDCDGIKENQEKCKKHLCIYFRSYEWFSEKYQEIYPFYEKDHYKLFKDAFYERLNNIKESNSEAYQSSDDPKCLLREVKENEKCFWKVIGNGYDEVYSSFGKEENGLNLCFECFQKKNATFVWNH